MTQNTQAPELSSTKQLLLFGFIFSVLATIAYFLDYWLSETVGLYIVGAIIGFSFVKSAINLLKIVSFRRKFNPDSYLTDDQKKHYRFKNAIKQQWHPFYNAHGEINYTQLPVLAFTKRRSAPSHYPDAITKPLLSHVTLKEGVRVKEEGHFWNDMLLEPLSNEYGTVSEWFVKNDYDCFDDVEEQFKSVFKRQKKPSITILMAIVMAVFFSVYAGVYLMTFLGPFMSLLLGATASVLTYIVFIFGYLTQTISKNDNTTVLSSFNMLSFKLGPDYDYHLEKFDFSKLSIMGEGVIFCTFSLNPDKTKGPIRPYSPLKIQYMPQASAQDNKFLVYLKWENERDEAHQKIERALNQYLKDNNIDFLNMSEQQKEQLRACLGSDFEPKRFPQY